MLLLKVAGSNLVAIGIDLKKFYPSVEWDILEIPAGRNEEYYPCCSEPFSGGLIIYFKRQIVSFNRINDFWFHCRHHL